MPKGTKVEEVYRRLLKEGYSVEEAVRIAQKRTGLSLRTGKKPRRK